MDLPVVNHKDYFAKIGDDHKFPINKFGDLADYLIKEKIVKKFHKPYPCSVETLKKAHSEEYISNIKNKTLDEIGVKKIGFPLVDSVVKRSFIATGGTVLASKLAINYGVACNTAGGSHHANYHGGAGYCVFNDVAVASHYLLKKKIVKKFHKPYPCSDETLKKAHSENYQIFYSQMIESLEACVNGKPIRIIE